MKRNYFYKSEFKKSSRREARQALIASKKELYKISELFSGEDEDSWKLGLDLMMSNDYFNKYKPNNFMFNDALTHAVNYWNPKKEELNFSRYSVMNIRDILDDVFVYLKSIDRFRLIFKNYKSLGFYYNFKETVNRSITYSGQVYSYHLTASSGLVQQIENISSTL